MDFHQEVGLVGNDPAPHVPVYPCDQCEFIGDSIEVLRAHRFEMHPLEIASLLIRGREVGRQALVITTPLQPADVLLLSANDVSVNNKRCDAIELGQVLSAYSSGTVQIEFGQDAGRFPRVLHFRVASSGDIEGVEGRFRELASGGRLDRRAIEYFIDSSRQFSSAELYCNGICEYLYGILAKERTEETDIPYRKYRSKLNQAAESLNGIDRPLAQQLLSLIDFNFNFIRSIIQRSATGRVGQASSRLRDWAHGFLDETEDEHEVAKSWDYMLADADTEQLIVWSDMSLAKLQGFGEDLEAFIKKPLAEFDKSKAQIIAAATGINSGDLELAKRHAADLYHMKNPQLSTEGLLARIHEH